MEKPLLYSCVVCEGTGELLVCNSPKDPQDHVEWEVSCDYCSGKGLIDHELPNSEAKWIREQLEARTGSEPEYELW